MSVGKRLLDLARANFSSLLDRGDRALKDFSDEEIAAELKRREEKKQRQEEEKLTRDREELEANRRAAQRKSNEAVAAAQARAATGRAKTTASSSTKAPPPRASASTSTTNARKKADERYMPPPKAAPGKIDPKRLRELYAKLEVPYNAPYEEVKSGFRRLMRKYHPDLHVGDPKKHKAATELSMSLTSAYRELETYLKK